MLIIRDDQIKVFEDERRTSVLMQHRELLVRQRPDAAQLEPALLNAVLAHWHGQAIGFGFVLSCDVYMYLLVCYDCGPAFANDPMIRKILARKTIPPLVRLDAALVWANQHNIGGLSDGGKEGVKQQKDQLFAQEQRP